MNSKNFLKKIQTIAYKIKSASFVKNILIFYFIITLIGSLFLLMPISHEEKSVNYVDSLFTAASAFSDTGLTTVTTSTTWTMFGQFIIAMLIIIGGIGWFALKIYLFNILFGKPINFKSRQTLAAERGTSKVGHTSELIKISLTILFSILFISSIVLSIYFYNSAPDEHPFGQIDSITGLPKPSMIITNPYHDVSESIKFGIFHSVSALNNAGFDIIGGNSLMPYYHSYGLQIIFMILFIIGGIGYPVIYDVYLWAISKLKGTNHRWTLFTKLSMSAYVIVAILGISSTFAIEVTSSNPKSLWNLDMYGTKGDKTMALIFNTMSTRNAGFATIDMHHLTDATLIQYSIMMFIGSAPSSTAGGIRTTTMAIVIISIWSRIRGKNTVRAFNRRIPNDTVLKSFVVFVVAMIMILTSSLIGMTSLSNHGGDVDAKNYNYVSVFFEMTSAFGTTGLSTGITPKLSIATKLVLILLMFTGQLGVSSSLLVWDTRKNSFKKYNYIKEDVATG